LILIANLSQGLSVCDIMQEFGLVSYRDYIGRCTDFRNQALGQDTLAVAG
jgi:hypothetical protein